MKTIELIQGTPEWVAHRSRHFNASDAPAMMGCSSYKKRSDLIRERATGIVPDIDAATQRRFDDGHLFESLARPLAEEIIGETLYSVTGVDGEYSASFDGITMAEDTCFEHKTLNDNIRAAQTVMDLPIEYRIQMEHQLMVSDAERCLFMASKWKLDSDTGEYKLEEKVEFWYLPDLELRKKIEAGWEHFAKDVADYTPEVAAPVVVAAAVEDLPVLSVEISGQVVASNLAQWKGGVLARLVEINTDLQTEQDFADAEKMVKFLDDGEKRIDLVKSQAQAQASSIDTLFRAMDEIKAMMKQKRLELSKLVTSRKEAIKEDILLESNQAFAQHACEINDSLGVAVISPNIKSALAGAIKNKRTIDSLREAANNEVMRQKIVADELAATVRKNKKAMGEHAHLFPDFRSVCTKAQDDFAAMVSMRVTEEEKRIEAEHQRALDAAQAKLNTQPPSLVSTQTKEGAEETPAPGQRETSPAASTELIMLGDINRMLYPIAVNADFLKTLGFEPVKIEKVAKLYNKYDFPAMCLGIIEHIKTAATKLDLRKAA